MWIKRGPVFKEVTEHTYNTVFKARGFEPVEEPAQPETVTEIPDEPAQTEKAKATKRQVKKDA